MCLLFDDRVAMGILLAQGQVGELRSYLGYDRARIVNAMNADQGAFLQQAVCTLERMGSFTIAAGFSVRSCATAL